MKQNISDRLSMIEDTMYTEPKDWVKKIRTEFQHLRQFHAKLTKKNKQTGSSPLDLTPAMEKRRTAALLASLEKFDEEHLKYADNWIMLNIFGESYYGIQSDGHILTAASIWILDRLAELNIPPEKFYPLLPRDDELLDDLFVFDVWDSQYEEELIASVEYVLSYRNQDIAPLESCGEDSFRVITSNLAAEGKDHADVPSRQNFEALLALLPQCMKDEAVKQFEECFKVWTDRYFAGVEYLQEQYIEKRDKINAVRREINEIRDKLERKAEQFVSARKRAKKTQKGSAVKPPVNALLTNPAQVNADLLVSSPANPVLSATPLSTLFSSGIGGIDPEVGILLNRLRELDELHDKATQELSDLSKEQGKILYITVHQGYLSSDMAEECFPSELSAELLKPLPIKDPYELCFALLCLVETGSDIPWLYGSCIGMMSEITDYLPWGLYDYDELEDPYLEHTPPASSRTPDFPDWYQRTYSQKGDNEYNTRSLAQIVYETTGCLMPRNLHQYDAELKELGRYGIRQNKAISVLYCMLALSSSRRRKGANNLNDDYMRFLLSEEETEAEEKNSEDKANAPADWESQKTALEKQIQQLRSALYNAEKSAEDTKKKLEEQKSAAEAEHRELADLREIMFNKEEFENSDNSDAPESIDNNKYPYTVQKSTVVFGGHETWVKSLKPLLKGDIKFIAKEMKIDVSLVRYADVIWIQSNAIPHRSYYSIVNTARKLGKPVRYFTNASAAKCADQIVENDKCS